MELRGFEPRTSLQGTAENALKERSRKSNESNFSLRIVKFLFLAYQAGIEEHIPRLGDDKIKNFDKNFDPSNGWQ